MNRLGGFVKRVIFAVVGLAFAVSALAELSKYKDWDRSAEAYFLTPAERTEWKALATDADAEKFIALYWAKRGGERFKQEISRRIAAADQQFKLARYKHGSDSVRGRLLVVLGPPSRVGQSRAQEGGALDGSEGATIPRTDTAFSGDATSAAILYTWTWEKDKLPEVLGLTELRAQISVDPRVGTDELRGGAQAEKAMSTIAEKSIVNPNATLTAAAPAAPAGGAAAPAPAPAGAAPAPAAGAPAAGGAAAAAPPPAPAVVPLPAAVKTALESAPSAVAGEAGFWSGTFRSPAGDDFLAMQFYLPANKAAFSAASPLKLGGVVTDDSGKEVQSFWEDATFSEVAEGNRKDRVIDKSIPLPAGSYKGKFGVFSAEGQPPLASASFPFTLNPKSTEFEVSPLILSSGLVPLTKRPGPTDPFVFGDVKPIKVEPKGDRAFSKQDSLWYFYAVTNPTLPAAAPAAAADAAPAPAATPAAGAAPAAPAAAPAAEPKPRIMTRINVQRDGQDAFAPFTGPADLMPVSGGRYGTGSEIPLASFEPGYYTFAILVRDLNAPRGSPANKGVERKDDFIVLMPDGSLPPKKAPAAPAPPKKKS
jgi:GWxTD domain-containing protein